MDFNNLSRSDLVAARIKCDESLLFFTRFWFRVLKGQKFIVNWHHEEICKDLEALERYELELLNINIPPRFSKTELAAVNFIARGIGMNPSSNWLYITASDELRSQTSVSIRDIVTHPYFRIMYGVELKKDQNAKNLWRTNTGGGLKTATIFGQITGFGAGQMVEHNTDLEEFIRDFEGCIIMDDINKTDDSEVQNANNDKVSRVFFNTVLSRKNSSDTPIINIQQRAGHTDMTGQLQDHFKDNTKAKFLVLPVIIDGVPLWEWKHNLEDIEELRTSPKTAHVFETQYMQNPYIDKEGYVFYHEDLITFDEARIEKIIKAGDYQGVCMFVDVADTGEDTHSGPIGYLIGDLVYIVDVLFTQEPTSINTPMTAAKIKEHGVDYTRIETNGVGAMYINSLRPLVPEKHMILSVKAKSHKHTRILTAELGIKKFFRFKKNHDPESQYGKFMKQLTNYKRDESVKKDDAPDSLTGLYKMFNSFYSVWN